MKEKLLYAVWACLYVLCVGLGFVQEAQGVGRFLLVLTALVFFLPGAALLYHGYQTKNRKVLLRVRVISILSLSLSAVLIIANLLSVGASAQTGKILHELLALVSAPMLCGGYWALSLFLWACLLMGTFLKKFTD